MKYINQFNSALHKCDFNSKSYKLIYLFPDFKAYFNKISR